MLKNRTTYNNSRSPGTEMLTIIFLIVFMVALFIKVIFY
jgi:hypothetical protein